MAKHVEVVGRNGERIDWVDVPDEAPSVIQIHARYFVRDDVKFYNGTKYVETVPMRIEKRAEGARGGPENRKAASA
jgi:hypothetical protein